MSKSILLLFKIAQTVVKCVDLLTEDTTF